MTEPDIVQLVLVHANAENDEPVLRHGRPTPSLWEIKPREVNAKPAPRGALSEQSDVWAPHSS